MPGGGQSAVGKRGGALTELTDSQHWVNWAKST